MNFRPLSRRGQAAAEMLLVIPLLGLLAAGLFQFALLLVCRVQFDDACGQSAREWASGARRSSALAEGVRASLGSYRAYFDENSFQMESLPDGVDSGSRGRLLAETGRLGAWMKRLGHAAFDVSSGHWRVSARFKSRPLFGLIFPHGVIFRSEVCVLRHPAEEP